MLSNGILTPFKYAFYYRRLTTTAASSCFTFIAVPVCVCTALTTKTNCLHVWKPNLFIAGTCKRSWESTPDCCQLACQLLEEEDMNAKLRWAPSFTWWWTHCWLLGLFLKLLQTWLDSLTSFSHEQTCHSFAAHGSCVLTTVGMPCL